MAIFSMPVRGPRSVSPFLRQSPAPLVLFMVPDSAVFRNRWTGPRIGFFIMRPKRADRAGTETYECKDLRGTQTAIPALLNRFQPALLSTFLRAMILRQPY